MGTFDGGDYDGDDESDDDDDDANDDNENKKYRLIITPAMATLAGPKLNSVC